MPTAVDYILEALAKALEVERECGVRTIETDRSLLKTVESAPAARPPRTEPPRAEPAAAVLAVPVTAPSETGLLDFVFLHHAPLLPNGIEMMAKIVTAMGKTPETAPIVFTGERPKAKIYIVLGSKALRQWFPGRIGSPGKWLKGEQGEDVLVTYSPEHILRFGTVVTPAIKAMKVEMWTSLKGALQKLKFSRS